MAMVDGGGRTKHAAGPSLHLCLTALVGFSFVLTNDTTVGLNRLRSKSSILQLEFSYLNHLQKKVRLECRVWCSVLITHKCRCFPCVHLGGTLSADPVYGRLITWKTEFEIQSELSNQTELQFHQENKFV